MSFFHSVIMDNTPVGLFLMVDQLDKHWLKAAFNGDNDDGTTGVLYMGNYVLQNSTAKKQYTSDLSYLGDNPASYGVNGAYLLKAKSSDKENKDFTRLAEFTKQIAESKNRSAKAWKEIMDVDVFLIK
jgi:spore coat protein CotH